MASIKLSFSLRTSSKVNQVHLVGSWDSYKGQLPLARESGSTHKWKATFRFSTMKPGQRYWFYYMLDGYCVSHDPSRDFTVEPTTGRKLNILDVPKSASSKSSSSSSSSSSSKSSSSSSSSSSTKRSSRRLSREIPRGQPAAEIRSPKPVRPGHIAQRFEDELSALSAQVERQMTLEEEYDDDSEIEDDSEDDYCPSLSSGASSLSGRSSTSSIASDCSCERYGITRAGERVKLDCGGSRCGSSDDEFEDEYTVHVRSSPRSHMRSQYA